MLPAVHSLKSEVCLHLCVIKDNIDELVKGRNGARHQTLENNPGTILY